MGYQLALRTDELLIWKIVNSSLAAGRPSYNTPATFIRGLLTAYEPYLPISNSLFDYRLLNSAAVISSEP